MPLVPKFAILNLPLYIPGTATSDDAKIPIKLASNEAALGPSPLALEAYRAAGAEMYRYPDAVGFELKLAVAERLRIKPAQIVLGAGSEGLIHLLTKAFAGPGDEVIVTQYAFQLYQIAAKVAGATVVSAADDPGLTAHVDSIVAALTPRTRMVFLANPNNPTGTLIPEAAVRRLFDVLPDNVLLVVDSAYAEYIDHPGYSAGTTMVDEGRDNIVVLGTFSKVYGLAGLRLGWAYSSPIVVAALDRVRPTFGVSVPAFRAGLAALADREHVAREIAHVRRFRPRLEQGLRALGLGVVPGTANFTLARMPIRAQSADPVIAHLKSSGILVRPVKHYGLPDCVRISVGTEAEIAALLAALARVRDTLIEPPRQAAMV